jgi:hypothetical protein
MQWESPPQHPFEKTENPQVYDRLNEYNEHPKPRQHILGIVGGNEVPYGGRLNQVEVESDLRGITRHNSFCPKRKHAAPANPSHITQIDRKNPALKVEVKPHTTPLAQSQMWAYPATLAPEPVVLKICVRPEKM